jgi:starch-binding outer membrane protein SusE/F
MNKLSIYKSLMLLVIVATFFTGCTNNQDNLRLNPTVTSLQMPYISSDSATIDCYVVAAGDGFTERGVCYSSTIQTPTTSDNKVIYEGETTKASYLVMLRGLTRLTTYYARPYAIGSDGTVYGGVITFTTPAAIPAIADITGPVIANTTENGITASTAVNITDDGGPHTTADITSRGVVYSLSSKPTISDSKTNDGTGKGEFTSLAKMLKGNVKYYLRAYATNSIGTAYSNEVSFTTPVGYAFVTTNASTKIGKDTATFNGVITYNGAGTVSESGFCYGLTADPTVDADTKVAVTAVNDTLKTKVSGLEVYTTYHVRAYVTNEVGTNYGADVVFTTLPDITKFWIVGDYNGWDNSDNAQYIISTASDPEAQGYVYLTAGGIKLATDHSWDNDHTFGDNGSGALTHPGNNITVAASGYYLIKANLTNMTYSLTLTTWGVMGSYNGWASQTDMTYNSASKTFSLALSLTAAGEFKFRGTSDWSINYGDTGADGKLEAGGDNIVVDLTADYAITLDLSHPNEYTYSLNRWGIIGAATGDASWSTDQNMTWDATNKVFTATIDMVVGEYKFRANDGWNVNLGGSLSALTQGGDNLAITTAGNYTITLDPWALVATVTAN